jgi:hypothetical protein
MHLIYHVPCRKGLVLNGESNELLEVFCLGKTVTPFPITNRFPGYSQDFGQSGLCQPDAGPHGQHGLSKSVVQFTIGGFPHVDYLFDYLSENS